MLSTDQQLELLNADENSLGVFAVVTTLHDCEQQLRCTVLFTVTPTAARNCTVQTATTNAKQTMHNTIKCQTCAKPGAAKFLCH